MAPCCSERETTNSVGESTNRLPHRARSGTRSTHWHTIQQVRQALWLAVLLTYAGAIQWYAQAIQSECRATFTRHTEYIYSMAARCEHADPGDVPLWWDDDGIKHDARRFLRAAVKANGPNP